jgi:hypothetical protein
MLLTSLLLTPMLGILAILINRDNEVSLKNIKFIALTTSIINFFISLIIFIIFDFNTNQFQFVQEYHEISYFDFYLGVDGLSIYFILLTTIIIPISLVSNWKSITKDVESYVIIILLLETLLLAVFLVLDILLFYIFFESILPPAWIYGKYSWWDILPNFGEALKVLILSHIWKYMSGWTNYSGIVTSQNMTLSSLGLTKELGCKNKFFAVEREMGDRVYKSVISNDIAVKEQRVDGSRYGNILPCLRCTLMGFERNYPVRIPSNQLNNLRPYSTVCSRVANSQVGTYLLKP